MTVFRNVDSLYWNDHLITFGPSSSYVGAPLHNGFALHRGQWHPARFEGADAVPETAISEAWFAGAEAVLIGGTIRVSPFVPKGATVDLKLGARP